MDIERVDLHQHFVPQVWVDAVAELDDPNAHVAPWSEDDALRAMDAMGTRLGVVSLTSPGVHFGDDAAARRLARAANEEGAELVARRGDRFATFASVPLPDVEGAIAEAVYALDELHAAGITLLSNVGGRYLGDPAFRELWRVLDERRAVVHVHPSSTAGLADLPGAAGWVDWPFDTTRTAVHLAVNGVLRDFRSVRIILAHAGGFVPYQSGRFEALASVTPGQSRETMHDDLRRFYFDTALSTPAATMAALVEFAGPDHVVFGSDWPYAPTPIAVDFAAGLDRFLDDHPEWATRINHGNAESFWAAATNDATTNDATTNDGETR
jgi:predicted TIM-barrel fold metal-dependent hydrolase